MMYVCAELAAAGQNLTKTSLWFTHTTCTALYISLYSHRKSSECASTAPWCTIL